MSRRRIVIMGLVQGVGFRPFVARLAASLALGGWVRNSHQGAEIEVEGNDQSLGDFVVRVVGDAPIAARITSVAESQVAPTGERSFRIEASRVEAPITVVMPHDRSPCLRCLSELDDPADRRYRYPFITCDDCGPRFTIIDDLPFDRHKTAMRDFALCPSCEGEYRDPGNRRFHAQTISCPACGPTLRFSESSQEAWGAASADALSRAAKALCQGKLLIVKGVGGFQLVCLATARSAIARARAYKMRQTKPFAVMAPSLDEIDRVCELSAEESRLLGDPATPIVLLGIRRPGPLAEVVDPGVAPGLGTLGVMLPSSPLHYLLGRDAGGWLVVTSANLKGEPMPIEDSGLSPRLRDAVDGILSHDRRIAHCADDSIARDAAGHTIILRSGRGMAPVEIAAATDRFASGISFGGHSKAAFALALGGRATQRFVLSQHLGELDSSLSMAAFRRELASFQKIYGLDGPDLLTVRDAHPTYGSTSLACERDETAITVFHHEAHLESLIVERGPFERALGVVCDGMGLGHDNHMWGGEFFLVDGKTRVRVGTLRSFPLPGGEVAIREPRRAALGMLFEIYGERAFEHSFARRAFTSRELGLIKIALERKLNAPRTTSLGRLFDGVSALLGFCDVAEYEAQAAMALESAAHDACRDGALAATPPLSMPWSRDALGLAIWDWQNILTATTEASTPAHRRASAAAFHAAIVEALRELAGNLHLEVVLLTGGVFQNALLVALCHQRLAEAGLRVVIHDRVPPGDGGLALGQMAAGAARFRGGCDVSCSTRQSHEHLG